MRGFKLSHLLTSKMTRLENTDSPRHEFYVHQALIDAFCHPLCDELRGYWRVFDGETVGRFAQYLYQADCDYPTSIPTGAKALNIAVSDEPEPLPKPQGDSVGVAGGVLGGVQAPVEVTQAKLLRYAKIYILSYSQGMSALSDICIIRLCRELGGISSPVVDRQLTEDVVELSRYVYCSPRDAVQPKPLQPAWTELKDLLSDLLVPNIEVVEGNREFMALVEECGALAADMMTKTIRRLRSAEAALVKANQAAITAEAARAEAEASRVEADAARSKAEAALRRLRSY